jgi:hypothetical protein
MELENFNNRSELYAYLHANKASLIRQKRATVKHADGVVVLVPQLITPNGDIRTKLLVQYKADPSTAAALLDKDSLAVKVIINTSNVMDSHDDVHIPGLWKKSLNENKNILFLQEHKVEFDHIIADGAELRAFTKEYLWYDLGYTMEGTTQALEFDATILFRRNPEMFYNYAMGYVKNHSVGMQYIKVDLAFNDARYEDEYAVWSKYRPMISNGEVPDEKGYFYAVTEARILEGSAVPLGSNSFTPTIGVKQEPVQPTLSVSELQLLFKIIN